jgi:acyl-coenzyme A thioesterase PaaI-like protein
MTGVTVEEFRSGPMLMGLADLVMYAALLSRIGRVELAVTTSLTINFLRKPPPAAVVAEGKLLKLGRRLAVGEVALFTEGESDMVAHVVATYSIPPQ